jgi:hypothetical protein
MIGSHFIDRNKESQFGSLCKLIERLDCDNSEEETRNERWELLVYDQEEVFQLSSLGI